MCMDWISKTHKRFFKMMPLLIAAILCMAQVSPLFANYETTCNFKSRSGIPSVSSPQAHQCCCSSESRPCCCDVSRKTEAPWPEMTLTAVSSSVYDPTPRGLDSDTGFPFLLLIQTPKSVERWNKTDPSLQSRYLVNLTFRC